MALAHDAAEALLHPIVDENMIPAQQPALPPPPTRAIAAGNQQPVDRARRMTFEPIELDAEDDLTAIAGHLFGKRAELPYLSPEDR